MGSRTARQVPALASSCREIRAGLRRDAEITDKSEIGGGLLDRPTTLCTTCPGDPDSLPVSREVLMRVLPFVAVLVLVLALPAAVRGQTPDERAAARSIVAKHGPALVTVLGTVKIRMTMAGREAPPNEE